MKGLVDMLKWNHKFENENRYNILQFLEPYKNKLIIEESNEIFLKGYSREASDFR